MPVSPDYLAYVIDQFAPVAKLVSRRMFGGIGLYAEGLFFALIDNDVLYLKVDDRNRPDYVARGARPLQPLANDPTYSMNYFQLPEDVLEDPDTLRIWARKSLDAALTRALAKQRGPKKNKNGRKAVSAATKRKSARTVAAKRGK